jgi:spore maturation protein SpmA
MSPTAFEPAIPASDRPLTLVLDRAATGIGLDRAATGIGLDRAATGIGLDRAATGIGSSIKLSIKKPLT